MKRLLALAAAGVLACATPAPDRPLLRVGTSGDYSPFSHADADAPDGLGGFDVALVRAFAADQGFALEWVRFRWPELVSDLGAGRFDLALGGVTVRPERSAAGRFSLATARGGALLLHRDPARFARPEDLDAPDVRLAVNAGGHLERVARAQFPRAQLLLSANAAVPEALAEGRADAVLTDVFEAPHWLGRLPDAVALGPFTRDRKAWLVRAARPALTRRIDAWLLEREADGTLASLRARHFAASGDAEATSPATATPLAGLVAALDERLALMPAVAEAKRAHGGDVRDPERELRVLAAAVKAVSAAAAEAALPVPHPTSVRALFDAQIAAARQIQEEVLAGPAAAGDPLDLADELRPALLRIGERIAWLLVRLPRSLSPERAERAVSAGLDPPHLAPEARERIARMLAALLAARPPETPR